MARSAISPSTRFKIFARDGFRCRYCGCSADQQPLEVDHAYPVVAGGDNDNGNLVTACHPCNAGKRDKILRLIPHQREFALLYLITMRLVLKYPYEVTGGLITSIGASLFNSGADLHLLNFDVEQADSLLDAIEMIADAAGLDVDEVVG